MKKIVMLSALCVSIVASFVAHATNVVDLQVNGVIRPAACQLNFTGGGVIDYGTIEAQRISTDVLTILDAKTVPFTVNCALSTKIALRLVDNKGSSVVPGLAWAGVGLNDDRAYGLGTKNGQNIGSYVVQVEHNSVIGTQPGGSQTPVAVLNGNAGSGNNWTANSTLYFLSNGQDDWKAFSSEGTVPQEYSSLAGNLSVTSMIDKGSNLPLEEEIKLNGSATLELMYL